MKTLLEFLAESVIDLPRKTLAKNVWVLSDDAEDPKLKPSVKHKIESGLVQLSKICPVLDKQLIGSILTKTYTDDADLDINVLFDTDSEEIHEKLKKKASTINGDVAPGTKHPINYFVIIDPEQFRRAGRLSDGIYDIESGQWLRKPIDSPFNIDAYLADFQSKVKKLDLLKGELARDLVDVERLKEFSPEEVAEFKEKLSSKVQEIERDVKDIIGVYIQSAEDRKLVFSTELTPKEIKKYGAKNRLPQNIIYKLLERYYYLRFAKKLKKIIGDDEKLSSDEVDKLDKLVLHEPEEE